MVTSKLPDIYDHQWAALILIGLCRHCEEMPPGVGVHAPLLRRLH